MLKTFRLHADYDTEDTPVCHDRPVLSVCKSTVSAT